MATPVDSVRIGRQELLVKVVQLSTRKTLFRRIIPVMTASAARALLAPRVAEQAPHVAEDDWGVGALNQPFLPEPDAPAE